MRILNSFLCLSVFLFASCEKENQEAPSENNNSKPAKTVVVEPIKPKPQPKPQPKPTPKPVPIPVPLPDPTPDPKPEPKPQQPGFSRELLAAVKNWTKVSPHVFPLKSVRINHELNFKVYTKSGQEVGSSFMPKGSEVVAIGLQGTTLTVSPSIGARMFAKINIEQTDFKQGVAYLFELRKWQRRRQQELLANQALARKNSPSRPTGSLASTRPATKPAQSGSKSDNSLFEDLPQPGDYGHGKFCICGDCRKKRLAQTGSLK